jgi:hypothetical protein
MAIQDPLTGLIIGCCFKALANELGPSEELAGDARGRKGMKKGQPRAEKQILHAATFKKAKWISARRSQ